MTRLKQSITPCGVCPRASRALIVIAAIAATTFGYACEDVTVGQSLFQIERDTHLLCLIAEEDDPVARPLYDRLTAWRDGPAKDINLAIEWLSPRAGDVLWSDYGMSEAPGDLPQVVLVARHALRRIAFVADTWQPGPTDEDLDLLLDSPLRQALRAELPQSLAAIVYAPGDAEDGQGLRSTLESVTEEWARGRVTADGVLHAPQPVPLLQLDRDDARERAVTAFSGADQNRDNWVAVFAGRARMMIPPLRGANITPTRLHEQLDKLVGPCTCIESPGSLGVEIPFLWTSAEQSLISARLTPLYSEISLGERVPPQVDVPIEPSPMPLVALAAVGAMAALAGIAIAAYVWKWKRRVSAMLEEL